MINVLALLTANVLLSIIVLVLSAIPLYLAVKFVGGQAGIVKIILLSLLLSLSSAAAYYYIGMFAGLFMFIATMFVYKLAFQISLLKAFIAWVLQYVFVVIALFAVIFILGISI